MIECQVAVTSRLVKINTLHAGCIFVSVQSGLMKITGILKFYLKIIESESVFVTLDFVHHREHMTFLIWSSFFLSFVDSSCDKKAKKLRSHYLANPMAEYMHFSHHKDRELDKTYKEYQGKLGKNYTSLTEHERRKHIFKHNLRCSVYYMKAIV